MQYVQLVHDKKLGMCPLKKIMKFDEEEASSLDVDYVVTFRRIARKDAIVENNVNACKRYTNKWKGNILCYALEADSVIAPVIFWDIAHSLEVGNKIYIKGEVSKNLYLQRDYYKESFRCSKFREDCYVFEKIDLLPAEENKGMDNWSFGIPVGPDDATLLNLLVKRILEFQCTKEIILCGKPADNFKYWDKVRIVGEDIPAPPVRISKKKNRLIKEARYENLCILHDRVMLPVDFIEQMKRYGDMYAFTTLQSFYFDDYHNLTPLRYSDFDELMFENGVFNIHKLKGNDMHVTAYNNMMFKQIEEQGFAYANVLLHSDKCYPTGSLYILKKNIGMKYFMDESLNWEEFEDIEYGLRMNEMGVVTRVNPYCFSQSMIARVGVIGLYGRQYYNAMHEIKFWKGGMHRIVRKYKPMIKLKKEKAIVNMMKFSEKYCENVKIAAADLNQKERILILNQLIILSKLERTPEKIEEFLTDIEKLLLMNKFSYYERKRYKDELYNNPEEGKMHILYGFWYLTQFALRTKSDIFYSSMIDYCVKKTLAVRMGSMITSFLLWREQGNVFYHPDGLKGYYNAIMNSTAWLEKE